MSTRYLKGSDDAESSAAIASEEYQNAWPIKTQFQNFSWSTPMRYPLIVDPTTCPAILNLNVNRGNWRQDFDDCDTVCGTVEGLRNGSTCSNDLSATQSHSLANETPGSPLSPPPGPAAYAASPRHKTTRRGTKVSLRDAEAGISYHRAGKIKERKPYSPPRTMTLSQVILIVVDIMLSVFVVVFCSVVSRDASTTPQKFKTWSPWLVAFTNALPTVYVITFLNVVISCSIRVVKVEIKRRRAGKQGPDCSECRGVEAHPSFLQEWLAAHIAALFASCWAIYRFPNLVNS